MNIDVSIDLEQRIATLVASREQYVRTCEQARATLSFAQEQLAKHDGAIVELRRLLSDMSAAAGQVVDSSTA